MRNAIRPSTMRSINRALILRLLRDEGPMSRTHIARDLDLSLPTVMRIIENLVEDNFVRYQGTSEASGGRRRPLLEFDGGGHVIVGVDIGGTKVHGAIVDLAGNIQKELRFRWAEQSEADRYTLSPILKMIDGLLKSERPRPQEVLGIGIGAPGVTLSDEGIIDWAPSLGWRKFPIGAEVAEQFGLPVFVENDVNLAALGEYEFGAGREVQSMVSIFVGTGIGAGIVIDGSLYRGYNQAAGELGYMLPGIAYLNRRYDEFGALEGFASGLGIAQRARVLLGQNGDDITGNDLAAQDVFDAARRAEPWAQQIVDETVDYLTLAIANITALLDPALIVISGGIARSADLLIDPISARMDGLVPFVPRIVPSHLGSMATIKGAIALVMNNLTDPYVVSLGHS